MSELEKSREGRGLSVQEAVARGVRFYNAGRLREAETIFLRVVTAAPAAKWAWVNLAATQARQRRETEALKSIERALELDETVGEAAVVKATVLWSLDRAAEAIEVCRHHVSVASDTLKLYRLLVTYLEIVGRTDELEEALEVALRKFPDDGVIKLALVEKHYRLGDIEAADKLIKTISETDFDGVTDKKGVTRRFFYKKGLIQDRLGNISEAFENFAKSNAVEREAALALGVRPNKAHDNIETLRRIYHPERVEKLPKFKPQDDLKDPVFLVGFPRSGTTLLDTILLSHRDIDVIEEEPTFAAARDYVQEFGDYPAALAWFRDYETARQRYYEKLARYVDVPRKGDDRIVVDKLPLNSIQAGFLHQLFPTAKFIFAVRHPCDCVLSCFMHQFGRNDAMANFFTLEEAAGYYDRVVSLWRSLESSLGLDAYYNYYERLVTDFEGEVTKILDFLGLDWDAGVRQYRETALARGKIGTPSYNQVVQPLYKSASGRWRRYESYMQDVMPVLEPWIGYWGYDEPA
jgi:tetratricopeptide (TPR) repeat protein